MTRLLSVHEERTADDREKIRSLGLEPEIKKSEIKENESKENAIKENEKKARATLHQYTSQRG